MPRQEDHNVRDRENTIEREWERASASHRPTFDVAEGAVGLDGHSRQVGVVDAGSTGAIAIRAAHTVVTRIGSGHR